MRSILKPCAVEQKTVGLTDFIGAARIDRQPGRLITVQQKFAPRIRIVRFRKTCLARQSAQSRAQKCQIGAA